MFQNKGQSSPKETIFQATQNQYDQVASFLNQDLRIHRHLDWFYILDWLDTHAFLIALKDEQIRALLCVTNENHNTAWIRAFAVKKTLRYKDYWDRLLEWAMTDLKRNGTHRIASLSLHKWYGGLLENSGFNNRQKIIVLSWQGDFPPCGKINDEIELELMKIDDLPQIAAVDQHAFPHLWQNSLMGLTKAFNQTGISTVARVNGQIVGYQISTVMTIYGHLARLAVHPSYQRQGIAYTLVYDLLKRFEERGLFRVTVNTQSDNTASLMLYDQFGFTRTGEDIPVYEIIL